MDERARPAPPVEEGGAPSAPPAPATPGETAPAVPLPVEPPRDARPPAGLPPVDPSDPSAPAFDAGGDPLPARTFAPGLDDASLGFFSTPRLPAGCPWCGALLPDPEPGTCPTCGAALRPAADLPEIPGVTVAPADVRRTVRDVSPEIRALVAPPVTDEIARPGARPELDPPDPAVRRAMLELELEARGLRADDSAGNQESPPEQ